MANYKPNQKKKHRPNWFDIQIQNLGPDFVSKLKIEEIVRDCRVIFRDLVRGNIDIMTYYSYLADPTIITAMYNECLRKYNEYSIISMAMNSYVYMLNSTPNVQSEQLSQVIIVQQTMGAKFTVYGQLLQAIDRAKTTHDMASAYIPLPATIGKYAYVLD